MKPLAFLFTLIPGGFFVLLAICALGGRGLFLPSDDGAQ